MNAIEKVTLFSVEMLKTKITTHDKVKDFVMTKIYPDFLKNGPNDLIQNSYTDYIEGATFCHWPFLINLYMPTIKTMLFEYGVNLNNPWNIKVSPWYVLTTSNTAEFVHDHMGGSTNIQFSAVHYVVLDDDSTGTVFVNPNEKLMKAVVPTKDQSLLDSCFVGSRQCPIITEGDFVMFPSWVDHHAPKHTSGNLRAVIAMNIMLSIVDRTGL